MFLLLKTNSSKHAEVYGFWPADSNNVKVDGTLEFIHENGGNSSKPSYQEASGAPVENVSPLGLEVTWFTALFLNIGQMIGTGVFSTPASILKGVGSVGLSLIFWTLGLLITAAQLLVYVELASYFPNRSGAEVVYLEQGYPRPKYLFATAFAVQSVLLSFSSSNAIVMAEYLYATGAYTPSAWELKGLAVACMTLIILLVIFSTKVSLRSFNGIGIIKIITLVFINITGIVVLGGHTRVKNPHANFQHSFEVTTPANGYGLSNALVKVNFAYTRYTNAFNVVNEVKVCVVASFSLYLANTRKPEPYQDSEKNSTIFIAYSGYSVYSLQHCLHCSVPKASLKTSKQLAASVFFHNVFGSKKAPRALNFLIALSAFGNIISVIIGSSRIIRRQGVLPYPRVWASTRPFGTPLAPYALKWSLTVLMTLAPPAGDLFNFIVDLQSYPSNMFLFATTFGLVLIRRRRARLGISRTEFRVWNVAIIFSLAVNVFLLVMPWYPPPGGQYGGDVSFWYATYCATGLGILALCSLYYVFWIYILPHFGHYRIRQDLLHLEDETAKAHRLIKVPTSEVEKWDAKHGPTGQRLPAASPSMGSESGEIRRRNEKELTEVKV